MKLPQLHLRDLFWLMLVSALAVAWWVDRSMLAFDRDFDRSFYQSEINGLMNRVKD